MLFVLINLTISSNSNLYLLNVIDRIVPYIKKTKIDCVKK